MSSLETVYSGFDNSKHTYNSAWGTVLAHIWPIPAGGREVQTGVMAEEIDPACEGGYTLAGRNDSTGCQLI